MRVTCFLSSEASGVIAPMRSVALKTTTTGLSFPRCHELPALQVSKRLAGQGGGGVGFVAIRI